ncbi:putative disease resistance RPP13-like protein 3 [Sesamum alatum]|uniref:Disease resistance RPP13-like protein 3 n=1 Tax=Sesamum alatum TaxID=300844 RepID=A0AAE1YXD2_9LAMI|nr:putative disease resistance RPP13-like protein 3 [Sesamum alatum]
MDDVWDTEVWDYVKRLVPKDNNGSRIMLTSRLEDVAIYVNSNGSIHRVRFLSTTESWNLLHKMVFERECCPPELENLGKNIAESCHGLPLGVVVTGGLLSKANNTWEYWKNVAESVNSFATTNDNRCLEILSMSYNHLPHHLKACFLYMGVFPGDYKIPVSKLIKLRVAEGFIKTTGSKSLEEAAEEYLEDLVRRNLILACQKRSNGKIKRCSIHDLVRDMCIREAKEEKFLHFINS